jgi:hypothetical protein
MIFLEFSNFLNRVSPYFNAMDSVLGINLKNHAMAEVFSHQPPSMEAQVQSQVSPCVSCGQGATGTGFSLTSLVLPCQCHSTILPKSFSHFSMTPHNIISINHKIV